MEIYKRLASLNTADTDNHVLMNVSANPTLVSTISVTNPDTTEKKFSLSLDPGTTVDAYYPQESIDIKVLIERKSATYNHPNYGTVNKYDVVVSLDGGTTWTSYELPNFVNVPAGSLGSQPAISNAAIYYTGNIKYSLVGTKFAYIARAFHPGSYNEYYVIISTNNFTSYDISPVILNYDNTAYLTPAQGNTVFLEMTNTGRYVIAGSGMVKYSDDAINWTSVSGNNNPLYSYSAPVFMKKLGDYIFMAPQGSNYYNCALTTDGANWVPVSMGASSNGMYGSFDAIKDGDSFIFANNENSDRLFVLNNISTIAASTPGEFNNIQTFYYYNVLSNLPSYPTGYYTLPRIVKIGNKVMVNASEPSFGSYYYLSEDNGVTWSFYSRPWEGVQGPVGIAENYSSSGDAILFTYGSLFIAIGKFSTHSSTDGINWTTVIDRGYSIINWTSERGIYEFNTNISYQIYNQFLDTSGSQLFNTPNSTKLYKDYSFPARTTVDLQPGIVVHPGSSGHTFVMNGSSNLIVNAFGMETDDARYKLLGQFGSNSTSQSTNAFYKVPANKETVIKSIIVCNSGANSDTFSIAFVSNGAVGATPSTSDYIRYEETIAAKTTKVIKVPFTIQSGTLVVVNSTNSTTSFNLFGAEF